MLKGINNLLTPDLLKVLMEMGHGDELVISDGNFPTASMANNLVRLDGNNVPEVLDAILSVLPLDQYVEEPVAYKTCQKRNSKVVYVVGTRSFNFRPSWQPQFGVTY